MQSPFRRSISIIQGTPLARQAGACVLIALISSSGCGLISNAPERELPTDGVSQSESRRGRPSSGRSTSQPGPTENPPVAKLPAPGQPASVETGLASWYGPNFHGKRTASGEIFNQEKFTAAHPTLPWGSRVKVTNLANGKSVDVRINDRGPYGKGRIIDLSLAAAKALGMVGRGITTVKVERLTDADKSRDLVLQEK